MIVAQAFAILGTGLLAGIFLMGTIGIRPAADNLEATPHLLLRQHLIRRLSKFMPWLMVFAIAASALAVWQADAPLLRFYRIVECLLSLAILVITIVVNVPVNNRFLNWTPATLPDNWQTYVRRWNDADSVRLVVALFAFLVALIAGS